MCILGGLIQISHAKIQIHCMGDVVPSNFDVSCILEPETQDFSFSAAKIGNIPFLICSLNIVSVAPNHWRTVFNFALLKLHLTRIQQYINT